MIDGGDHHDRLSDSQDLTLVGSSFCKELKLAIAQDYPDPVEVARAIDKQPMNDTTIGLSNHLLANTFLAGERLSLIELRVRLMGVRGIHSIKELAKIHTTSINIQFDDLFTADREEFVERARDDELFRQFMCPFEPSDDFPLVVKQVYSFEQGALRAPGEIYDYVSDVKNKLLEDLWGGVHHARTVSMGKSTLGRPQEGLSLVGVVDDRVVRQIAAVEGRLLDLHRVAPSKNG